MLDINLLRQDPELISQRLAIRGITFNHNQFNALDSAQRSAQTKIQELRATRNEYAKQIGMAKQQQSESGDLMAKATAVNAEIKLLETGLVEINQDLEAFLGDLPNLPHSSVSTGKDESDNAFIRACGSPRTFDFPIRDHVALGEKDGAMDFALAAKLAGARFVVMKDDLVLLHRALINFMLDLHRIDHGYREFYVPYLVNSESLYATGQLPKFADDQFKTCDSNPFYLIPTAEVPLTNIVRDQILIADQLPIKLIAHTPCFRREAGAYGKDTKGMIRQHQFEKVEMVQIVQPTESYHALEEMTGHAEKVLQMLELPYRIVSLCGGDLGFSACKTYDLEVWLPAQNCYREISSCSNTEAFQARRMRARWRSAPGKKSDFLHTLNGSGVAVGRAMIAIMENHQNSDGSISIPSALRPYLGNRKNLLEKQK